MFSAATPAWLLPSLAVAVAAAFAGCGSAGSAGDRPASAPATGSATTAATASTTSSSGAEAVTIKGFSYTPKRIVVPVGTRVSWVNRDAANHTVTFVKGSRRTLGNQPRGVRRSMRFTKAGTYSYVCDYHPGMSGQVVVR